MGRGLLQSLRLLEHCHLNLLVKLVAEEGLVEFAVFVNGNQILEAGQLELAAEVMGFLVRLDAVLIEDLVHGILLIGILLQGVREGQCLVKQFEFEVAHLLVLVVFFLKLKVVALALQVSEVLLLRLEDEVAHEELDDVIAVLGLVAGLVQSDALGQVLFEVG